MFVLSAVFASAHTLFMAVEDNEDGSVMVEGIYSTGAMAGNHKVYFKDNEGKILWQGKTDEFGQVVVDKPDIPYTIILDGGPGHSAEEVGPPKLESE
jgi:hypothetical protein